jgi:hypothetical protein
VLLSIQVALDNDASCVEALYNLGLCHKQLKRYEESLEIFFKLQSIVRNHPEVMYQVEKAIKLFSSSLVKRHSKLKRLPLASLFGQTFYSRKLPKPNQA